MTFEETKAYILENEEIITSIYSKDLYYSLNSLMEFIENNMADDTSSEKKELPESLVLSVNDIILLSIDTLIDKNLSKDIENLLDIIILIVSNVFDNFKGSFNDQNLKILVTLRASEKSILDQILLNSYLCKRLRYILDCSDTTSSLSQKYLEEYEKMLKNKNLNGDYFI